MKDPSCVPDNTKDIHTKLVTWADAGKADIILTMGGAGLAAKDKGCLVRGHAGSAVFDVVRIAGIHPLAALSRPAAGFRGKTVIVNMPGSKKAVKECYMFSNVDLISVRGLTTLIRHKQDEKS